MLSSDEIARGTRGALRFLWRDRAAPLAFENTPEACLRSFQVMLLVAPLYAAYMALHYLRITATADDSEILFIEALRYVVNWLFYPVLFFEIARWRGWLDRYARYIAALNWSSLPAMVLLLLIQLVSTVVPSGILNLLQFVIEVYWFLMVTQLALAVSWPIAVALAIVNLVPSHLFSSLVDQFLGIVYPV